MASSSYREDAGDAAEGAPGARAAPAPAPRWTGAPAAPGPQRRPAGRWWVIDSARGTALLAVCLSHFAITYFARTPGTRPEHLLLVIGLFATPTFILVSGTVLGFLAAGRPSALLRRRLVDRGLFLLLVAHAVILVAHVPFVGGLTAALRWEFVTDTIAVCLVVGPLVVLRLGPRARLGAAAAGYVLSWVVVALPPWPGWAGGVREVLFGALRLEHLGYGFPVVPWLCVYLAATPLGERLRALREAGEGRHASPLLFRLALAAVGLAALGTALHHGLKHVATFPGQAYLAALTAAAQKLPPGPVYLGLEGGMGLGLLALFAHLDRTDRFTALGRGTAVVGRSSLLGFVVQYFVYYSAVTLIRPLPSRWWPAWLALSMALVVCATVVWDRWQLNRIFTVGLAPGDGAGG
jgi:uncharacterized membrane protein